MEFVFFLLFLNQLSRQDYSIVDLLKVNGKSREKILLKLIKYNRNK